MPNKTILEPNEQRAKNAIALIWIVLTLTVIGVAYNVYEYCLLLIIEKGHEISTEVASTSDTVITIFDWISFIIYIVSIITFLRWFGCAYSNLHKKTTNLLYSKNWAIISWFVPVIFFYRPYRIAKELFYKTKMLLAKKELQISFSADLLSCWWIFYIVSFSIGILALGSDYINISDYNSLEADKIESLKFGIICDILFLYVIDIVLALITIKVIKDYSKIEPLLEKVNKEEIL